jgi:uncharacterized damage-inducible protein DinB
MARAAIDEWIYLFNSAFDGRWQSVLKNLESVTAAEWCAVPAGGVRSIRDIVAHIGMFKYMYPTSAFRGREFEYGDNPATPPAARLANRDAAVEWLKEAHAYLLESFETMEDDSELDEMRPAHWGELLPTRVLMSIVLEHDTYHAGEINRGRALLQGNDEFE